MAEAFLDRLIRPEPEPRPAVIPTAPRDASAYAAAALRGEVENILAVPIGSGRNHQLNVSAVKMYGLAAAGALDEHTVTEVLGAADGGLDYPATRRTLQSAREAVFGRLGARAIPAPTHTPRREVAPWEQTDDPFDDNFVEPQHAPPSGSTSAPHGHANSTGTPTSTSTNGAAGSSDGSASDAAATPPTSTQADQDDKARYEAAVALEASQQRLRREARRRIDHEEALAQFRVPEWTATLTDELAIPDEPVTYRVADLIPAGANVLLAAQFKAGKTTLVTNLARALVDGEDFLGRFNIEPFDGRVGIFNYEVTRDQYRRWLRDVGFVNTDKATTLPLRGYRLDLRVPHIETWVVEWLRQHDVRVWIVDPFARAATGIDENSNTEVGQFLDTLDVIKQRAGVSELILPTHTGRAEHEQGDERARGATRLDDWADVRWLLTKDKTDTRYFRATGRDVDTDEAALAFDPATRLLTLTGGDRATVAARAVRDAILAVIEGRPGVGISDLRTGVRQILGTASQGRVDKAVEGLIFDRRIHVEKNGRANGHYLGAGTPEASRDPFA